METCFIGDDVDDDGRKFYGICLWHFLLIDDGTMIFLYQMRGRRHVGSVCQFINFSDIHFESRPFHITSIFDVDYVESWCSKLLVKILIMCLRINSTKND